MTKQYKKWELTDTLKEAHNKYNENLDIAEENLSNTKNEIEKVVKKILEEGASGKLYSLEIDASNESTDLWIPYVITFPDYSSGTVTTKPLNPIIKMYSVTDLTNSVVNGKKSTNSTHYTGGVYLFCDLDLRITDDVNLCSVSGKIHSSYCVKDKNSPIMVSVKSAKASLSSPTEKYLVLRLLGGWKYTFYFSSKPNLKTDKFVGDTGVPSIAHFVNFVVGATSGNIEGTSDNNKTILINPHTETGSKIWSENNLKLPVEHKEGTTKGINIKGVEKGSETYSLSLDEDGINASIPGTPEYLWINKNSEKAYTGVGIGKHKNSPKYNPYGRLLGSNFVSCSKGMFTAIQMETLINKQEYPNSGEPMFLVYQSIHNLPKVVSASYLCDHVRNLVAAYSSKKILVRYIGVAAPTEAASILYSSNSKLCENLNDTNYVWDTTIRYEGKYYVTVAIEGIVPNVILSDENVSHKFFNRKNFLRCIWDLSINKTKILANLPSGYENIDIAMCNTMFTYYSSSYLLYGTILKKNNLLGDMLILNVNNTMELTKELST